MSAFPDDVLARPRPRDAFEQLRPRWQEAGVTLGSILGAVALGLAAVFAPLNSHHVLELRFGLGLVAFALLQILGRRARRSGGWPPQLEEAMGLFRAGDLDAARAGLDGLLHQPRIHPAFRASALAALGLIELRTGNAARAQDLWAEVARSGHWKERGLRVMLGGFSALLSLGAAIEGDLPRSKRWLRECPQIDEEIDAGPRALAGTYLALREGQAESARRFAIAGWTQAQATLPPAELRGLRVLAAMAEADPESLSARRWRGGARPGWPGELDYLAQTWPELAAYLRAHGFSASTGQRHG